MSLETSNLPETLLTVPTSQTNKKLIWSAIGAAIFMAVSLPQAYNQTSRLTQTINNKCPTPEGKFIHAALFFAVNYFVMKLAASNKWMNMEQKPDALLAKYAFYGTLLFFLISSSDTYRLTGKLFSGVADEYGCPEIKGVLLHGVVFLAVLVLIMFFPKDK